ncbi:MAG: cobalamin B12-binding domain-containing protein [Thermosulfidibacteraceae bacterium]|jgi:methylmalonyl-CoA mutase C-terminal domain/subunit
MADERKVKILVAKPGLDGHDRGAKVVARALRDAGFEVIYTGLHQSIDQIVQTALQEDVDAIGISILSGAHMYVFPTLIQKMKEVGLDDVIVFGGGIIPLDDIPKLKEAGVKEIFLPGTSLETIVEWVRENVKPRKVTL